MSVFFSPLVGNRYHDVLILGESHYCDKGCSDCGISRAHPECADFTKRVIADYLDPRNEREGWMNTYLKFERSLVGHETIPGESARIWDSIAFYNYLQVAMGGPRQAGTSEQYRQAGTALFEVLEQLRPKLMIAWGKQLWRNLPNTYWTDSDALVVRTRSGYVEHEDVGYYTLPSGHVVHALCVYHPSAGYDWSYWHDVIEAMKEKINI